MLVLPMDSVRQSKMATGGSTGMGDQHWLVVVGVSGALCAVVYTDIANLDMLQTAARSLFLLGILTAAVHLSWNMIAALFKRDPEPHPHRVHTEEDETRLQQRLQEARERVQKDHEVKAIDYAERILKPKEAAELEKKEKEHYRFIGGPKFKGQGWALGYGDGETHAGSSQVYGGARDAAIARKLPESAVPKLAPQAADVKRRTKRVITLPQEPAPGEPETVTVGLKCPNGKVHRRRFHTATAVHILYDWMQTLGYHPTVYGISSTFPRRSFDPHRDRTLAQVGVTTDMVVMVDERDSEEEGD
ncbi:UBX domain-containing protein 8-like isoform X3 [Branchiostoma floridae]|uniref:UBX domain-containing protein 8-like isoform X3 n=1 Tax=Branchiostoma floridae TaxID=7739 RepID=A0A9J7MJK8_BRAFL|nr:UBX domain-containing protein 8-like isoform X3 [Branchiostoma floridae]